MLFSRSRGLAGSVSLRVRSSRRLALAFFSYAALLVLMSASAHAVIVRGLLTDPLGTPISHGRVQLVQDGKVVAFRLRRGGWIL